MNIQSWILAARPQTLPAAVSPVVLATVFASSAGVAHFTTALFCLCAAILIQIGTNLANDYYDFRKGADTKERIGPKRVTQSGLIAPSMVKNGFIACFFLASIFGLLVIERAGLPIALIGLLSLVCGWLYTGGPKPLAYVGLGEVFVLIFFGPVAFAGTYFAQALTVTPLVILAGFGPGLLSTALIAVNNYRDVETDKKASKNTIAVRFGRDFARGVYISSVSLALLLPVLLVFLTQSHYFSLAALLLFIPAVYFFRTITTKTDGASLNKLLGSTGKLLIVYTILLSLGWLL